MSRKLGIVFLSHSSRDRKFVERLAGVLQQHRIRYWYSATHIAGAKQWHDEIGRALKRCRWFLVVLTPSSVTSQWVKHELLFALGESRYNERIIPLLLKPCHPARLSWTLSQFQFVDFTGSFEAGCKKLLHVWGRPFQPAIGTVRRKITKRTTKRDRKP
jgi:TIR domain